MARSINQIQESILQTIEDSSELTALEVLTEEEQTDLGEALDSDSKVSIWRKVVYIIALATWVIETMWDVFRAEITAIVEANRPHNESWYKNKALAFQYGDELVDDDEYEVIDPEKQIIKQVAVISGDRKVVVKIAGEEDGELVQIDDLDEVNAFTAYMNKVKDAGTLLEIVNEAADLLKVDLDFFYDPLLVNGAGQLISNPGDSVVETAIVAYLESLDFNGEFDLNRMNDYVQRATGYKSLKVNFVGFKAGIAVSYSEITRAYQPLSGYMKLEELTVNYYAVV